MSSPPASWPASHREKRTRRWSDRRQGLASARVEGRRAEGEAPGEVRSQRTGGDTHLARRLRLHRTEVTTNRV